MTWCSYTYRVLGHHFHLPPVHLRHQRVDKTGVHRWAHSRCLLEKQLILFNEITKCGNILKLPEDKDARTFLKGRAADNAPVLTAVLTDLAMDLATLVTLFIDEIVLEVMEQSDGEERDEDRDNTVFLRPIV